MVLLFNSTEVLFPSPEMKSVFWSINPIKDWMIFSLVGIKTGKIFGILILVSVIIGYIPQITSILHWWVAFSYMNYCPFINGGDEIHSILTLFLIPICVSDNRLNHWQKAKITKKPIRNFISNITLYAIKIQFSIIYLHAAIGKLFEIDWLNGTALYYWFNNSFFGMPDLLNSIVNYFLSIGWLSLFSTWAVIVLELLLAGGLIIKSKFKPILYLMGVVFHVLIFLMIGLFSFASVMIAGLTLYLYPLTNNEKTNNKQ